jgi:hypothetical protein
MAVLRWVVRIAAGLVALVGLVFLGARFHDGPLGPIPGGALASGEVVAEPVSDWSFAKDVAEVELQLDSEAGSRTVWILVQDGRATLRIEGRRYPVVLAKTDDPALGQALRQEVDRKYGRVPPGESGVWIFQVTSPGA